MKISFVFLTAVLSLAFCINSANAQPKPNDWPQFRGPNRNGITNEPVDYSKWPAAGPTRVWSVQVGPGFSSISISNGKAYTMGTSPDKNVKMDTVWCLDALTGKEIWHYTYPAARNSTDHLTIPYPGPQATPTVDGQRVYTISVDGHLICLDSSTGKMIWDKKLIDEFGIGDKQIRFGFSGSPLVVGDHLILSLGAGAAALDKATGKVIWKWHDKDDDSGGYASPVLFDNGGKPSIATFTKSLVALSADSGEELWRLNKFQPYDHGLNGADPVFDGNMFFLSQGNYTRACGVWRFGGGKPTKVWENETDNASMLVHFPTPVLSQGFLYGNNNGKLRCIEMKTGNVAWTADDISGDKYISEIIADGKLIALTDKGELVVLELDSNSCKVLARAKIITGPAWAPPALAAGKLYCRSNKGEVVCVEVGKN